MYYAHNYVGGSWTSRRKHTHHEHIKNTQTWHEVENFEEEDTKPITFFGEWWGNNSRQENLKQCDYKVDNKIRVGMREMEIRGCDKKNDKGGRFTKRSDTANACENATEVASSLGRDGTAQCTIATKANLNTHTCNQTHSQTQVKNKKLIPKVRKTY